MDYKKFLYEQKKREKALKSKATKVVVKEIRFGPNTDDHDYEFKKKHAEKFLKDGAKLKAFVFFKGRSIVFKEQGQILSHCQNGNGSLNFLPVSFSFRRRCGILVIAPE